MRASVYVAVGAWAPPKVQHLSTGGWRVCLGWVSVVAIPHDIEELIAKAGIALSRYQAQEAATPTPNGEAER